MIVPVVEDMGVDTDRREREVELDVAGGELLDEPAVNVDESTLQETVHGLGGVAPPV